MAAFSLAQALDLVEEAVLGEVQRVLAGRAMIRRTDDPVLPWVSRVAEAIFEGMKADLSRDPHWIEAAREGFRMLVEEAQEQARVWKAEDRPDYARRLSIALRREL
jgi:hypothetical protein